MYLVAVASDEDGDDQRTTSQTQFDGNGHTRDHQRERAEDNSEEDTHEDGGDIGRVQFVAGVTHADSDALDGILGAHDANLVSDL